MMREDPVERLRRANPIGRTLAAPPIGPLLDRVDEARPHAGMRPSARPVVHAGYGCLGVGVGRTCRLWVWG